MDNENTIEVWQWVNWLLQTGAIESENEYAHEVRKMNIRELQQNLANQPCDTPDAYELIDWAWEE